MAKGISAESKVKVKPSVISRQVQGEEVILDLKTGTYFGLNEVGTRSWSLFGDQKNLKQVTGAIVKEFDVPFERAEKDVHQLVIDLKKNGLVEVL
jgi:hypothetical protein